MTPFAKIRSFVAATLCFGALASPAMANSPSNDATVDVVINETQLLHLRRPAGSLIVGNPDIVTVAVHDDHTLLLTGLSFGSTNLIVLDSVGRTVHESRISVSEHTKSDTLTIARTGGTETLNCNTRCRPVNTALDE